MQCGVDITASDALDERADDVVVLVAIPVVAHRGRLHGGLQISEFDDITRAARRRHDAGGGFERGESSAGITPGDAQQVLARVVGQADSAVEPPGVDKRSIDQGRQILVVQWLEREDQAARQQWRDHREARVLGGRSDERHPAVLYRGQQRILLSFAKSMHLVDEEHGAAALHAELGTRRVDDLPHVFHTRCHGREFDEASARRCGHEAGKRGLSRAGWTPQDHRHRPLVAVEQATQR